MVTILLQYDQKEINLTIYFTRGLNLTPLILLVPNLSEEEGLIKQVSTSLIVIFTILVTKDNPRNRNVSKKIKVIACWDESSRNLNKRRKIIESAANEAIVYRTIRSNPKMM